MKQGAAMTFNIGKLLDQFDKTKGVLNEGALVLDTMNEFYKLLVHFYDYVEHTKSNLEASNEVSSVPNGDEANKAKDL
jgi:hypothetical protein